MVPTGRNSLAMAFALCVLSCTPRSVQVMNAAGSRDCETLQDALGDEEHWILEDAAVGAGQARCRGAIPALERVLGSPVAGPRARAEAGVALAVLNSTSSLGKILRALQVAQDAEERYWLVVATGRFCTPEALAALESAAGERNVVVSKGARKALLDCRSAGGQK